MKALLITLLLCSSLTQAAETSTQQNDTPWTTWYRHGFIKAVLKLKKMRDHLMENNMHDPHVVFPKNVECGEKELFFRTINGTCNDLEQTMMGAVGMRFGRNVPLEDGHSIDDEILVPNPRTISRELFTRKEFKPVPFLNMMAAAWIQFMTHDWFAHGPNDERDPFFVKLDENDPLRKEQPDMLVLRTRFDRTRSERDKVLPVTFQNHVTH